MGMKIYAGIGSRSTPPLVLGLMQKLAYNLSARGWKLRSGGAFGADTAFECGCDLVAGSKEIFTTSTTEAHWVSARALTMRLVDAMNILENANMDLSRMRPHIQRLLMRNTFQILGAQHDNPVDAVVCWTEDGQYVGGTRYALYLASMPEIWPDSIPKELRKPPRILNLAKKDDAAYVRNKIEVWNNAPKG